jgi:tetratricopeptide (TPR) repeat protein
MKRIVMFFAAVAMSASVALAQDINAVTEIYNNGAMELDMGNKEAALGHFQTALTQAEALGEAGTAIADNCKATLPFLM